MMGNIFGFLMYKKSSSRSGGDDNASTRYFQEKFCYCLSGICMLMLTKFIGINLFLIIESFVLRLFHKMQF